MPKFHISNDGQPRECEATVQECKLGGVPHGEFGNLQEARAWAEAVLAKQHGAIPVLGRKGSASSHLPDLGPLKKELLEPANGNTGKGRTILTRVDEQIERAFQDGNPSFSGGIEAYKASVALANSFGLGFSELNKNDISAIFERISRLEKMGYFHEKDDRFAVNQLSDLSLEGKINLDDYPESALAKRAKAAVRKKVKEAKREKRQKFIDRFLDS